jgi:hypothetical protein
LQLPDSLSTAPHGFAFNGVYTSDPTGHFRIHDTEDRLDAEWEFDIGYAFHTDDTISFSSISGQKKLEGVIDGAVTPLVDRITSVSTWPIVFPGQNSMFFEHNPFFQIKHVEYYPTYWGV